MKCADTPIISKHVGIAKYHQIGEPLSFEAIDVSTKTIDNNIPITSQILLTINAISNNDHALFQVRVPFERHVERI